MFPEELMQVIAKYKDNNQSQIQNICDNLKEIITSLKCIQNNMTSDLYKISISDDLLDSTDILNDINILKEQISYIKSFTLNQTDEIKNNEILNNNIHDKIKEPVPIFTKKVRLYLTSDNLCPICNVKFIRHYIYYQKINFERNLNEILTIKSLENIGFSGLFIFVRR